MICVDAVFRRDKKGKDDTVPPESEKLFVAQGYGAALVRKLLRQLDWQEVLVENRTQVPQLFWAGSSLARSRLRPMQRPWQLVNGFPRGGTMGSKSSLLKNLRNHCRKTGAPSLDAFYPRSYDLSDPRDLYVFLLDFTVTRAEAVVRKISARTVKAEDAKDFMAATVLLDRLLPEFQRESGLQKRMNMAGKVPEEVTNLFAAEIALAMPEHFKAKKKDYVQDPVNSEADIVGALKMELRYWLKHLHEAPDRQHSLNGERAFWIMKEPCLNCGRGINVFSELVPLLAAAQKGGWDFVVQKYLERPLLVGAEKIKCDVRLWVVVTSWNPAVIWAWSEPYFRLASKPFSWDKDQVADPFVHLTNRTVQIKKDKDSPSFSAPKLEDEEHIWMLSKFFAWADQTRWRGPDGKSARDRWNTHTWPRILDAVRTCVRSSQVDVSSHLPGCFELFGFDFILDEDLEPWLLEANSSPDLCEDAGPSLRSLVDTALTDLFKLVPALQEGEDSLPLPVQTEDDTPEYDEFVKGSGGWRLCLRELGQCKVKDMELRRILRSPALSMKNVKGKQPFSPLHFELLNRFLGAKVLNRLQLCVQELAEEEGGKASPNGQPPVTSMESALALLHRPATSSSIKRDQSFGPMSSSFTSEAGGLDKSRNPALKKQLYAHKSLSNLINNAGGAGANSLTAPLQRLQDDWRGRRTLAASQTQELKFGRSNPRTSSVVRSSSGVRAESKPG